MTNKSEGTSEVGGYQAGVSFYLRKMEEISEKIDVVDEDSFDGVILLEELEEAELKLKQLERRKELGLIK